VRSQLCWSFQRIGTQIREEDNTSQGSADIAMLPVQPRPMPTSMGKYLLKMGEMGPIAFDTNASTWFEKADGYCNIIWPM